MHRRERVTWWFFGLVLFGGISPVSAQDRPEANVNFVFFLVDDLGWADVGCYGAPHYRTPNIDRLATEGMRFTDAYAACAVCSPTRASIMTGKYPARLHLTDFISGHVYPHAKLRVPRWRAYLPLEEVTLAEAMKEAGYRTFFAGKWHLGDRSQYWPQHQGFDQNLGGTGAGAPWTGYFSPYHNRQLPDGPEGEYLTDRLGDESVRFLESVGDDPFFLYLSFYSVHVPIQGKPGLVEEYTQNPALSGKDQAEYAAMIASVDENVGKVLAKLDEEELAENTVVIFTSDNGGIMGNAPLRHGKGTPYEGGIREPLLFRYPGRIERGSPCSVPVTSPDLYPTILDLAGLKPKPKQSIDGVSLVPLLRHTGLIDRKAIFWHYPHYHVSKPYGVVRSGPWKLIEFYEDMNVELYNLEEDISEALDLAQKNPRKAEELKTLLHEWQEKVGAQMMTPNPDFDPARETEKARGPDRAKWLDENIDRG